MTNYLHKGDLPDDLDLGAAPTAGIGSGRTVRLSMKVVDQETGEEIKQEG